MIKNKSIILSSIALAAILGLGACEGTDRYNRHDVEIISDEPTTPDTGNIISQDPDAKIGGGIVTPPDENVTIKAADNVYSIAIAPEFDSLTANQAQKIHYEIKNFLTDAIASDSDIEKIKFTVDDRFAKFINYKGEEGNVFELLDTGAKAIGDVAIKSLNNSGQINVKFDVTINGITNSMTKSFPVIIIKNRSSSISIIPVPKESAYDKYQNGLYIEKFTLHVVDKYGNKAKDGTFVHVGTINNLKKDNTINLYDKQLGTKGAFTVDTNTFNFDNNLNLSNVNSDNEQAIDDKDTIVILPNATRNDPRYLGGWRIESLSATNNAPFKLWESYAWEDKSGLSFAIGDDKKYNQCDSTLANAAIYSDSDYKVKDGIVNVELRYGPYMVGKSVFLYANSLIDNERIGISRKVDLAGTGIADMTYTCDASDMNTSRTCPWTGYLKFNDSGEDVKDVYIGRRYTTYGAVGAGNNFIGCDSAAHENIIAEAGKKVSVTVKYIIEQELP